MVTRFELEVMLRVQLGDRALLRRIMLQAAIAEGLVGERGAMAAMAAGLDVEMCAANPARLGEVAAERLVTEGADPELIEAVRTWRRGSDLAPLALALVVSAALAERILEARAQGERLDSLQPRQLSHGIRRAAEKRDDARAQRVIACAHAMGSELEQAAEQALEQARLVAQDLKL